MNQRSSFAVCRFGGLVHGHDGDEMRANRLTNGGVGCIFCGVRGPSTFDALINAAGDNVGTITRTDSRLDYRYNAQLQRGVAWASIVFDSPDQFKDDRPIGSFGSEYVSPSPQAKLPAVIDNAAKALSAIGFRVTGDHATNTGGTIIMVLGPQTYDGVKIELSWVY